VYEQVIVSFKVKFYTGTDKGFFMKKLNDEIVHYLTPWAFDENADVSFNQKIYASSIINFIEERSYVDFITDFLMGVCRNECCEHEGYADNKNSDDNRDEDVVTVPGRISGCNDMEHLLQDQSDFQGDIVAKPSTSRSILVSVPKHIITPYEEPEHLSRCEERKIQKPVPTRGGGTQIPAVDTVPAAGGLAPTGATPAVPADKRNEETFVEEAKTVDAAIGSDVPDTEVTVVLPEVNSEQVENDPATESAKPAEVTGETTSEKPLEMPAPGPVEKNGKRIRKSAVKKDKGTR
jgi:hypothetical protein